MIAIEDANEYYFPVIKKSGSKITIDESNEVLEIDGLNVQSSDTLEV